MANYGYNLGINDIVEAGKKIREEAGPMQELPCHIPKFEYGNPKGNGAQNVGKEATGMCRRLGYGS